MMCPRCGRDAPIVYRGPAPYCTACGELRVPLSDRSVNLAGKPSRLGGAVVRVAGWLVLLFGLSASVGLGLLVYWLSALTAALAVALPIAFVTLGIGVALVRGGRALSRSGVAAERTTHDRALLELAAHRGGVTAEDAARALDIPSGEADALLTALAKREPDRLTVDVDDHGVVWYRPARVGGEAFEARVRVGDPSGDAVSADEAEANEGDARTGIRR